MFRNIPMSQRLDKIGELLAKGAYLYLQKEKETAENEKNDNKVKDNEGISEEVS